MSRPPPPRSDPRSTGEIRREERAEDRAEHVAERLECAARRGHREERDEQMDRILAHMAQRLDSVYEAIVGDGRSSGLLGRLEAVEARQRGGARLGWVLVGTLFAAGGTVLAAVLTHGWQR